MDANGLKFGFDLLISIVFGASGALGVWFKLKGKVEIQEVEITTLKEEVKQMNESKKENNMIVHKRIDNVKDLVDKHKERADASMIEIKSEMNKMELRIITAIHELKK